MQFPFCFFFVLYPLSYLLMLTDELCNSEINTIPHESNSIVCHQTSNPIMLINSSGRRCKNPPLCTKFSLLDSELNLFFLLLINLPALFGRSPTTEHKFPPFKFTRYKRQHYPLIADHSVTHKGQLRVLIASETATNTSRLLLYCELPSG